MTDLNSEHRRQLAGRRPDLFIIGAAKCGTTSLYHYLREHPDIYMSPDKEPGYFAPDLAVGQPGEAMRHGQDEARYLSLFAGATTEQRLGEASVRYIYSREAPGLIKAFQPRPYIVAMIRNPIDMIYSMHGQRVAEGVEDLTDFAAALAAEPDRRAGRRIPAGVKNPRLVTYLDRARFSEQLPRWFDTFGRDRVHVIVLEAFVRDPNHHFSRLLRFLEVDPDYQPAEFRAHNPSHQPRSQSLRSALNAQKPRGAIRRLLPQQARDTLRRQLIRPIRRLNRQPRQRPPVPAGLRRQLELEFAEDVALTGELIDRDLLGLWFRQRAAIAS